MQIRATIDERNVFGRQLTELEQKQVPFATMQAINATAFDTRQRWMEVMPRIFDRPTQLTLKAVLYTKATLQKPVADIFIRDEAFKGTPPAKYLLAQVEGGTRRRKGIENRLTAAGYLAASAFVVPGKGAKLDQFGNIARSQLNQILSQLGAQFDPLTNETDKSRKRRRGRRKVRGGEFFAIKTQRGRLKPGIYERIATGFGSAVRSVLFFVNRVSYRKRYDIFDMARKIYTRRFPESFARELQKAVASSWSRTFK